LGLKSLGYNIIAPKIKNLRHILKATQKADLAIHLERVAPWWWNGKAKQHVLIPNQERYPIRLIKKLKHIDHVWCKSRHASEIFSQHHASVSYLGFTSEDRNLETESPDYHSFIHLAGRSTLKNTELILNLWQKHPEWPRLTLIQHPDNAPKIVPDHVHLISKYLPDSDLKKLQNSHGIHLCPSLSEGWGHYIVEAMSCRAVTITTDGPPMNEIVTPSRGILVPSTHSEPRHLGSNFHADPSALEKIIQTIITQPNLQKNELGNRARAWFEANQIEWLEHLNRLMKSL
jgi:glycosyltransferase involved in cell wall biosynthesis